MIILTTVTLENSNNAIPDDGDCTEICRSCFNVNFNVNFKIVFKTVHLCISWLIKNFGRIKMLASSSSLWGVQCVLCWGFVFCCAPINSRLCKLVTRGGRWYFHLRRRRSRRRTYLLACRLMSQKISAFTNPMLVYWWYHNVSLPRTLEALMKFVTVR
jgi:hypothetical protein